MKLVIIIQIRPGYQQTGIKTIFVYERDEDNLTKEKYYHNILRYHQKWHTKIAESCMKGQKFITGIGTQDISFVITGRS